MVADVGARIRSLRTAKGLTQAQLADPLYTKAYISMLESGRTRASMKALEHIAGVLGVRPADLQEEPLRQRRRSTHCLKRDAWWSRAERTRPFLFSRVSRRVSAL